MMKTIKKNILLTVLLSVMTLCNPIWAEETTSEADFDYTGVYNGKQLIPNSMAIFCKRNAEEFISNKALLADCINKIAAKINNSDAQVATEGKQDLSQMKYDMIVDVLALAISKSAAISNYNDVQTSMSDASSQTQTEHDDNAAIINTISVLTDVINSMRDLYAEKLKLTVLDGIDRLNAQVLADAASQTETEKEEKKEDNSSVGGTSDVSNKFETTIADYKKEKPYLGDIVYNTENQCMRNVCTGETEDTANCEKQYFTCPDGTFSDASDSEAVVTCKDGTCTRVGGTEYTQAADNTEESSDGDTADSTETTDESSDYSFHSVATYNKDTKLCGGVECEDGYYYTSDLKTCVLCIDGSCSGAGVSTSSCGDAGAVQVTASANSSTSSDSEYHDGVSVDAETGKCGDDGNDCEDGFYKSGSSCVACFDGNCTTTDMRYCQ
jgi:hypothetical protein